MAMEEIRMARMSKEEQARREGMAYALRFAREKGLDALEADLKMRNKRIKQMFERFDNKAECIAEDYSTWEEQISIIAEECGIDMDSERRDLRTVIK